MAGGGPAGPGTPRIGLQQTTAPKQVGGGVGQEVPSRSVISLSARVKAEQGCWKSSVKWRQDACSTQETVLSQGLENKNKKTIHTLVTPEKIGSLCRMHENDTISDAS